MSGVLNGIPNPIMLIAGLALLLGGGYSLVEGAALIARRFGVSPLLIGLTIVALGTSAPELFLNVNAALTDHAGLSFGNVVGSNIANIGLVLGIAAIVAPLSVHSRVLRKELPLLIVVTVALIALAYLPFSRVGEGARDFGYSRFDGAIFVLGFIGCTIVWYRLAQQDRNDPLAKEAMGEAPESDSARHLGVALLMVVVGLVMLSAGGEAAKTGAVGLAVTLGLSETVIGLTIVALATSLPELVTSATAAYRGHGDIAVGNIVGSNLFNILLVLGVTSLLAPVPLPEGGWIDLIVVLVLTCALLPIAMTRRRLVRGEGVFLLSAYVAYIAWTVWQAR